MSSNRLFGPGGAPGAPGLLATQTAGAAAAVLPALQVVATSATETIILNPALNSATQALVLSIPPSSQLEQRKFSIEASGYVSTGASSTVTINIKSGTSTTVGSDTTVATSGAITAFSGKTPWFMHIEAVYDSVSGKLTGFFNGSVNNVLVANTALSSVLSAITNVGAGQGAPVLNFVLSVAFGTGNAANTINVQEFAVNF